MTPEQKAANIALLARVVMGWTTVNGYIRVIKGETGFEVRWDPYTNNDDAMGMLNRFEWWELKHDGAGYYCMIYGVTKGTGNTYRVAREKNYFDSICTACLEWAWAQKGGGK